MKKLLFSLLALVVVNVGTSNAQRVVQRQIAHLKFIEGIEFFAHCDVVFSSRGGEAVGLQYTTGVHARLMNGHQLSDAVLKAQTVSPNYPENEPYSATEISYVWEWDLSQDWNTGQNGKGTGSVIIKFTDFRYDWSLPDEVPMS